MRDKKKSLIDVDIFVIGADGDDVEIRGRQTAMSPRVSCDEHLPSMRYASERSTLGRPKDRPTVRRIEQIRRMLVG